MNDKIREFLNSGLLYVHGRDHKFRPILFFNVNRIDRKQFDFDLVTDGLTFWLRYIIYEWMLPLQVEHWVFICNIKGMGMASLAVSSVRKLFAYLQCNFKVRLFRTYLINSSAAIYAPWKVAQKFLDGDTKEKIEFFKGPIPKALFTHANPEQVEQQYGGTAPNCTQFWPPSLPSKNYFVSPEDQKNLISVEQYRELYKRGDLKNMKVNEALIAEKPLVSPQQTVKEIAKPLSHSLQDVDDGQHIASRSTLSSLDTLHDNPPPVMAQIKRTRTKSRYSFKEEDYFDGMDEDLMVSHLGMEPIPQFDTHFL